MLELPQGKVQVWSQLYLRTRFRFAKNQRAAGVGKSGTTDCDMPKPILGAADRAGNDADSGGGDGYFKSEEEKAGTISGISTREKSYEKLFKTQEIVV